MTLGGAAFTSVEKTQGHSSCLSERAVLLFIYYQDDEMEMSWAWHVARMGVINSFKSVVEKPEGKRPLGKRIICRWEDNIKIDVKERI
jgi:hypothetical protein